MKWLAAHRDVVLVLIGMALAGPAPAQQPLPRVGVLWPRDGAMLPLYQTFERVLTERGWTPGKKVQLEYLSPSAEEFNYTAGARELVRRKVDIIYAASAPAFRAAFAETRQIPIVTLDFTTDPVRGGFIESYARPGGNVTGVFLDAPEFASKWLEILRTLKPDLKRAAVLWDPSPGRVHVDGLRQAAEAFGVQLQIFTVNTPQDITAAFKNLRRGTQAVVQLPSPLMYAQSAHVGQLTRQHNLLGISIWRRFSEAGGAVSYGPDFIESTERSTLMVVRLLQGARAAEVPIERPMRFEFLLNVATLRAQKIKIPEAYRVGADFVGEP